MENKLIFIIVSLLLMGCKEFKGEQLELNYKLGYAKILSDDYLIDSLIIGNSNNKYLIIGRIDKNKGSNIIYFNKKNVDYKVYNDSLDYYCLHKPNTKSFGIELFIKKIKNSDDDFENTQYFNYNQIPCNSNIVDTIVARNPYK